MKYDCPACKLEFKTQQELSQHFRDRYNIEGLNL